MEYTPPPLFCHTASPHLQFRIPSTLNSSHCQTFLVCPPPPPRGKWFIQFIYTVMYDGGLTCLPKVKRWMVCISPRPVHYLIVICIHWSWTVEPDFLFYYCQRLSKWLVVFFFRLHICYNVVYKTWLITNKTTNLFPVVVKTFSHSPG